MDAVAISLALLEDAQADHDLKRLARTYIDKGRGLLFERHRSGAGGLEVGAAWSTVMDHLIRHLFAAISAEWSNRVPKSNSQFALVAKGGYGRGELNPQSDIDLLFLYSWKVSPFAEAVTEKLLYTLWDAGLQVGHATRSIADCLRLAHSDMRVRTSLLDARFLCGDYGLYGTFDKSVESRLIKKGVSRFIREKLSETHCRHQEFGGSVYMLEPEVKEGEGGLRDVQTARWIARAKLNVKDLDTLALNGIVNPADIANLKESQDFLLRVRNELHFSTGKHQDQLTFDQQEHVSAALGFEGEGTLRGVEVFMRAYYLHAAQINRLSTLVIHRVTDCDKPRFGAKYVFGRVLREGIRLSKGHLTVTKPEVLRSSPENLIRIFDDAYHVYTVDQHSLLLIKEIERLKSGDYKESLPLLTQLAREAEQMELLYLGLMFHDIGKGFGGGHSEIGARMVRSITRRMRLNADDGALVEFLVQHHLLMTHTAFRRDLEQEKTIFDFAKTMGSVNNLKMLYLLTFADVKAVGPDVWNPWKASLLGELYVKALNLLEEVEKGEFQRRDVLAVIRRVQTRVRRQLTKDHDEGKVEQFLEAMPERYFLSTPEDDITDHFELMERFRGKKAEVTVQHFPDRDCTSVVICTQDRPGLFASITGVLTALNLDILNARIFTASDGRILDVFRISHHGRKTSSMRPSLAVKM